MYSPGLNRAVLCIYFDFVMSESNIFKTIKYH
jgi:hypothetical protein